MRINKRSIIKFKEFEDARYLCLLDIIANNDTVFENDLRKVMITHS